MVPAGTHAVATARFRRFWGALKKRIFSFAKAGRHSKAQVSHFREIAVRTAWTRLGDARLQYINPWRTRLSIGMPDNVSRAARFTKRQFDRTEQVTR